MIKGHHYYLNFTFKAGSTIALLVGKQAWRPIMWLNTNISDSNPTSVSAGGKTPRIWKFTNFQIHWAKGVELSPNEQEYKSLYGNTQLTPIQKNVSLQSLKTNTYCFDLIPVGDKPPQTKAGSNISCLPRESNFELEAELKTKALQTIVLPDLPNGYVSEINLGSYVECFLESSESALVPALSAIEGYARSISLDTGNPLAKQSRIFLSILKTFSQSIGWDHFLKYASSPSQYANYTKLISMGARSVSLNGDLESKGKPILTRLIQRVDWYLELIQKSGGKFNTAIALHVVLADHKWFNEALTHLHQSEEIITRTLAASAGIFENFRAVLRGSIVWPHSSKLREVIESAGFKHAPTILKRDRVICSVCGVEVDGWRPWHNPWTFHDFLRHPANFQPALRVLLHAPNSEAISTLVTTAINRRKTPGTTHLMTFRSH